MSFKSSDLVADSLMSLTASFRTSLKWLDSTTPPTILLELHNQPSVGYYLSSIRLLPTSKRNVSTVGDERHGGTGVEGGENEITSAECRG